MDSVVALVTELDSDLSALCDENAVIRRLAEISITDLTSSDRQGDEVTGHGARSHGDDGTAAPDSSSPFEWPESRADTLRWAAALHRQLLGFEAEMSGWVLAPVRPVSAELARIVR